ncbi:MAG: lipopolysaccharide assembly protein LapB, partial [Dokdonella sp.]
MSELSLLFLLLPVAAFSGWYVARRGSERTSGARVSELSSNYFRGLNYLLNEQQDKAIEVFLKLAEYNRDTVETHLALGNLFRRRGEVDRAIRVHQNLIARPSLSEAEKTIALLELGEDYMRAGLLDRAETLFTDLVAMDALAPSALTHLVAIYQHERDWNKAIDNARKLEAATGESRGEIIAQFHCELAEQARSRAAWEQARESLDAALQAEHDCVRASMILGHIESALGNLDAAIAAFEHVAERDVDYVPEILSPLLDCYARAQRMQRAEEFLLRMTERHQGVSPVLALAKLYTRTKGEKSAVEFLTRQLHQRPSVRALMALIDANLHNAEGEARESFLIQRDLTRKLLEGQAMYRCTRCGFGAKA